MGTSLGTIFIDLKVNLKALDEANKKIKQFSKTVNVNVNKVNKSVKKIDKTVDKTEKNWRKRWDKMGKTMERVGIIMTGVTATLAFMFRDVIGRAAFDELEFVKLRKILPVTDREARKLQESLRGLVKEIPLAAHEISNVGAEAARLGVKSKDIKNFTEVMGKMSFATVLGSTEAAISLARFANIVKLPLENIEKVGSAIVHLGNNFAANEKEITKMALRIGSLKVVAGATIPQILGLSAAFPAVGLFPELVGTSLTRIFIRIQNGVKKIGDTRKLLAALTEKSDDEFMKSWGKDQIGTLLKIGRGLKKAANSGINFAEALRAIGLDGHRITLVMAFMAGNTLLFEEAIRKATGAYERNIHLQREFDRFMASLSNKFRLLVNQVNLAKIQLGEQFLPGLKEIVVWLTNNFVPAITALVNEFGKLPKGLKTFTLAILGIIALGGPLALFIKSAISLITIIKIPFLIASLKIFGAIAAIALFIIYFGEIKKAVKETWNFLKVTFKNIGRDLSKALENAWKVTRKILGGLKAFGGGVADVVRDVINSLSKFQLDLVLAKEGTYDQLRGNPRRTDDEIVNSLNANNSKTARSLEGFIDKTIKKLGDGLGAISNDIRQSIEESKKEREKAREEAERSPVVQDALNNNETLKKLEEQKKYAEDLLKQGKGTKNTEGLLKDIEAKIEEVKNEIIKGYTKPTPLHIPSPRELTPEEKAIRAQEIRASAIKKATKKGEGFAALQSYSTNLDDLIVEFGEKKGTEIYKKIQKRFEYYKTYLELMDEGMANLNAHLKAQEMVYGKKGMDTPSHKQLRKATILDSKISDVIMKISIHPEHEMEKLSPEQLEIAKKLIDAEAAGRQAGNTFISAWGDTISQDFSGFLTNAMTQEIEDWGEYVKGFFRDLTKNLANTWNQFMSKAITGKFTSWFEKTRPGKKINETFIDKKTLKELSKEKSDAEAKEAELNALVPTTDIEKLKLELGIDPKDPLPMEHIIRLKEEQLAKWENHLATLDAKLLEREQAILTPSNVDVNTTNATINTSASLMDMATPAKDKVTETNEMTKSNSDFTRAVEEQKVASEKNKMAAEAQENAAVANENIAIKNGITVDKFQNSINPLISFVSGLLGKGGSFFKDVVLGTVGMVSGGGVSEGVDAVNKLKKTSPGGTENFQLSGGAAMGGLMVGEKGPEMIMNAKTTKTYGKHLTALNNGLRSDMGGTNVEQHFHLEPGVTQNDLSAALTNLQNQMYKKIIEDIRTPDTHLRRTLQGA